MEKKKQNQVATPEVPVSKPEEQDYTPDVLEVKKNLYQRDKDAFFADERLYRQDSVGQRGSLEKFFDQVSTPYYKNMGLADEKVISQLRSKFVDDNIGKLSLAKKKEKEAPVPEVDYPDFVDRSQIYGSLYSRQDVIKPSIADTDIHKSEEGYKAERYDTERVAAAIPGLIEQPEFNYIKDHPENYLLLKDTGEKRKVEKLLKGMDFTKDQRNQILNTLDYTVERSLIDKERSKWDPVALNNASAKEAIPFVEDAEPGTFIDPATGMRKLKPETDADADQLALIQKYQKEILNGIITGSPTHPLAKQKDELDKKQEELFALYPEVEEKRKLAEKSLEGALIATSPEIDDWKKAQSDFIKKQRDVEKQIKDFNDQVDQDNSLAGSVAKDPTDKERLQQIVNDAYIVKKFWDDHYNRLDQENKKSWERPVEKGIAGRLPRPVSPPPPGDAIYDARKKQYEATARFEAASRMLYNNEGPLDIKKDAKFQMEIYGDALLKGISKQEIPVGGKNTEMSILQKMGEIGMREGISWTPEELDHLKTGFLEQAMSFSGSLTADLPMLMLIGGATNTIKAAPLISDLRYGYKVIENPVLGKAGKPLIKRLRFADPVPTGWKVTKEAAPTAVGKLKGLLIASAIDEAAFTGMMGMAPLFMSGINTAHLFLPEVKLKGKWGNILQPFIDMAYKSAIGATVGMEAGLATSGAAKALFTDSTFKDEINKLYPNLDETTQRVLVELAVNGLFFGALGALSQGSQKAMTAPLGAKFGKSGGESWMGYFNPKMRSRVFDAARTADEKGYTDTAKELYRWLDMTKEPITGKEIKEQRLVDTEAMGKMMPVGAVRMAVDANRQAIRVLENMNNDPDFDGYVTLQTRTAKEVRPMDMVMMDDRYYEVTQVRADKKGNPIEFMLLDVETGKPTKAFAEDVKTDIYYKVGSRLELALRLENHYEKLQVFNEVLADKGFYGKEFQSLPEGPKPPKGLGKSTGEVFMKEPEPTKIEKRKKQLEEERLDMEEKGIKPVELPEKLKKEYAYGEPGKIMEMPAADFAENLSKAEKVIADQNLEYDRQAEEIKTKLADDKFKGRLDMDRRKERQNLEDEIIRIDHSREQLRVKMDDELFNFWNEAMPQMRDRILAKGEFSEPEIKDILSNVWNELAGPSEKNKGLSIGEIFDKSVDEFIGEAPKREPSGKITDDYTPTQIKGMYEFFGIKFDRILVSRLPDGTFNIKFNEEDPVNIRNNEDLINEFKKHTDADVSRIKEQLVQRGINIQEKPIAPADRMREIEKLVEAEGYRFEIEADADYNMTTVNVFSGNNQPVFLDDLPKGIKDLHDEFTKLTFELEIETENPDEKPATPKAEPQFPKDFKTDITSKTDKEGVKRTTYTLYEPDGETKVSKLTFDIEKKNGETFLSAPQIVTVTGQEGKGYATELYKYALQNLPEGVSGIYSIASEIHDKDAVGAIHKKLAEFFDVEKKDNGDTIFRPKGTTPKIESKDEERRIFANNQLVSLMEEYNQTSSKTAKSKLVPRINSLASEVGYTIKITGRKIEVLNEAGNKIRRISPKQENTTIEGITDPGLKEFVNFMLQAKDYLHGIDAPSMGPVGLQRSVDILLSGRATNQSQYLINALTSMYKEGFIKFKIDEEVIYEPIEGYINLIRDQKFAQFVANYGGLRMETIEVAAESGLFPKEEIELYKRAIEEENESRIKYEQEWAEEEAKLYGAEPGSGGDELPPIKSEGKPNEERKISTEGKIDIDKDLKEMTDLLKLLDDEVSFGAGGEGDDPLKIRLHRMASTIVRKFTDAGVTDFDEMLQQIVTKVDAPTMQKLLPFMKQGYGAISMDAPEDVMDKMSQNFKRVRMYGKNDLDALIAKMNAPKESKDDFKDIVNKEYFIPALSKKVKVIRVEEWGEEEYNRMVRQIEGLFTKDEKLPMLVVAFEGDPVTYAKLEQLREGIKSGRVKEVKPYSNPARAAAFERIASEFTKLGGTEMAEWIRARISKEPPKGVSVEQEIENMDAFLKERRLELQVRYGEIWFEKRPFNPINEDQLFAIIDKIEEGQSLEPFIRENVSADQINKVLRLENQLEAWMSVIGMTWDEIDAYRFLKEKFGGITPRLILSFIGQDARRIASGDKRTKPEKLNNRRKQLDEAIVDGFKKLDELKKFLFTWRVTYLLNKGEPIRDAKQLKFIASERFGISDITVIREQTELALTVLSNRIAQNSSRSLEDRFASLISLYQTFPLQTSFATSEVKTKQQYSTPVPLGFLMGVYTNADVVNSILDPTAGNGSLVIFANKKGVRVNEIDPNRYNNLMSQGYRASNMDASESLKGKFDFMQFDAVVTNPPFSLPVSGEFKGAGSHPYLLKGTHYMVARALENMADHGKAAILMGDHTEFDSSGRIKGADLKFFNWLHSNYYVDDVINIPGEFYRRMGTSFPTRLILVNGRKPAFEGNAPLKSEKDDPTNAIAGWTDLYKRVLTATTDPHEKAILRSPMDAVGRDATLIRSRDSVIPKNKEDIGPDADPSKPLSKPTGERPGEGAKPPIGTLPKPATGMEPERSGEPSPELPDDGKSHRSITDPNKRQPGNRGEVQPGPSLGGISGREPGKPVERVGRVLGLTNRKEGAVVPYVPLSRISSGNEMVPGTMAQQLEDALIQLKGEIGDIDNYVMEKLKYNSLEDLSSAFYGTQVDGIGMSVFNIENGDATIIGDQTGVGKGRIAAGIISYAIENGYVPVFITKTANLFTDMYRDLFDIGKTKYRPLIINREVNGESTKIYRPNTEEVMFTWNSNKYSHVITKGEMPDGVDFVLATYSQFNTDKGAARKRRDFLLNIAPNAVFIMDESHDASGSSNTGKFFAEFIQKAKGGVYLSATFAKRPDNLPIYAMKTVLRETNMSYEDLVEAIKNGGPALQEIISSQLAESIQFTRRQLNMENIERNWYILGDDEKGSFFYNPELGAELKRDYDGIAKIMHEIIDFQKIHVRPVIEAMDKDLKKQGEKAGLKKGTVDMGVYNHPYFSKVFNIVNQLLLSIKVKHAIPLIVDELRAGRKPFITLSNTMEAMLEDLNIEYGETVDADFKEVLKRGLNGVMRYTITTMSGVKESQQMDVTELSDSGVAAYKRLMDKIRKISTNITITPIDVLIKGITDAGFKVAEITGRHSKFELEDGFMRGKYMPNRRPNKNKMINAFNNEPGWAIIANVSGSTGLSAHSSAKFNDTSQRVGINLQPDLDVNVVVQKDGRINRSDQVNKPAYIHIVSVLPAEKRIAMMTAKKLKSLYANTTSNQKSSTSITETTDFLNKYGDKIVAEFLSENPDINSMMNNPIDLEKEDVSGAAHKVTGKIAVLPVDIQERFYEEISDRYEAEIEYLNNVGLNDLEVKSEQLNAVSVKKEVVIQGKGGISVFGDDSVLETMEIDILRKPLLKREIDDQVKSVLGEKDAETYTNDMVREMKDGVDAVFSARITSLQEKYDASVDAKRKEAEKKQGKAEDIEYWLSEQMIEMTEKHERMLEMYQDGASYTKDKIEGFMRFFYPGRVLEVPFSESDQLGLVRMNKGVLIGIDINLKKPNPYAPSNIMLKIATADSRRIFRIPLSKDGYVSQIRANSYGIRRNEQDETRENWDALKPSRDREKRFIVTGNILQAMNTFKGRLIEYTMKDGTVRTGILMPENWVNEDSGKVIVPATKAYNIIRGLAPMDFVESSSGNIQIMKLRLTEDGDPTYQLRLPESRSRGQRYWGDPGLKALVYEGIFEKHYDKLVGMIGTDNNLMKVLQYIQDKYGETFEVKSVNVQRDESSQASGINILTEFERTTRKINTHGERRPETEVQGARSKANMGQRIKSDPIVGQEPKPIWQILKDFSKVIDQKIFWDKSVRRTAAASYTPALGKLVVERMFKHRLEISTHEMGHRLDDMFGLVGTEAEPLYGVFDAELKELWQFGSDPKKGSSDARMYRRREGVAEFFRAYLVNPKETSRRYPEFTRWFEARVKRLSPKVWDAIQVLSNDVRVYMGASGMDRFGKHVKWGLPKEGKVPWGWSTLFKPATKMGDWVVTKFDVFAQHWLNEGRIAERAYRWVLGNRGIDIKDIKKIPMRENFIVLSHLLNGSMDKVGNMMMYGVTDNHLQRQIDPVTKQAVSFPWQYEAIPSASIAEMKDFMHQAYAVNAAERVLEVIWKLGGKQVRRDLAQSNDMLPPMDVLKKYPHIVEKYMDKIARIIDLINKGELTSEDVFYPEDRYDHDRDVIYGISQEGETDKAIAEKALAEYKKMKEADPLRAKQIEEFNRRYLLNIMNYNRYAWEGGLMSDDLWELINVEDLHYVAFHRYFREHGPESTSWDIKGFSDMYSIGKDSRGYEGKLHVYPIKGSVHPIADPYLVQIETAHSLITNTDKNQVLKSFVLAFTGDRRFSEGEPVQVADIGYITRTPGQSGTSMTFYIGGKPHYFTVQDPHIYEALKGLAQSPMFPKWATFFPGMLRTMVTHSIPFAIRNPIRDFFTRMVVGKAKGLPNIKKDLKYYDEKMRHMYDLAGGGQFGFYINNKVDYYRLQREWMFQQSNDPNKFFIDFKTFVNLSWDQIDNFFSKSEKINRLSLAKAEYDKALKEGMEPYDALLKAAFEARDLLDFHVAGTYMKSLNQFVVFSNAAIQGLSKIVRSARDRPGNFAAWWAMVALAPALANSLMIAAMDDDTIEEYKQLPAYQRDMYFNIPLGGGRWLSIPKPFELGYMASSVQRILDYYILDDKKAFTEDWYKLGYKAFFPFDFAGITGGFAGLLHVATNRDFFRDKWIIPPHEMDIAVALRNTESATRIGKAIQGLSGVDARKVDDFITAQFPYYGEYFLKASEAVLGGAPQKEMKFDFTDTGVIRTSPVYGAKDVQWVIQTSKKYSLNNHPYMDILNAAIRVYYSEEVQADRSLMLKTGQDIREIATKIRGQWDKPDVDFVKMYKEAEEIKKLKQ